MPKAIDERKAELAANPIAAIVADDRTRGRRSNHPVDLQRTRSREDRGGDQDGLAGHRNPAPSQPDDQKPREIAMGGDKVLERRNEFHVRATPCPGSSGARWRAP